MSCEHGIQRASERELSAQWIACGYVVRACGQALAELELDIEMAEGQEDRELLEEAAVLLADMVADWREIHDALREAGAGRPAAILRLANAG